MHCVKLDLSTINLHKCAMTKQIPATNQNLLFLTMLGEFIFNLLNGNPIAEAVCCNWFSNSRMTHGMETSNSGIIRTESNMKPYKMSQCINFRERVKCCKEITTGTCYRVIYHRDAIHRFGIRIS